LFAVSGDGSATPETLFTLDRSTAASTLVCGLGNSNDGETIAFNTNDGNLYHGSGFPSQNTIFEVITSTAPSTCTTTNIPLSGASYSEQNGLAYLPSENVFLTTSISSVLLTVSPTGVTTSVGTLDHPATGIAVVPETNSPPEITAPPDTTVECNEAGGASGVGLGEPTVSDNEDAEGDLVVQNDATEPFPLGPTTVEWQGTDTGGLTDSDTQTVTVVDTTDPDIDVPDGFMAIANTDGGWSGDIGQATVTDVCSDVEISNDTPDVFPLGDTTVEWCATDEAGNKTCDTQTINVKPLPVDIDIKPGSDPNSINPRSMGVVPVAILGSDSFDVADVDVTTLAFGPSGATPAHDLTDSDVYASHLEDVVVEDGITDLVSHYKQKETGLSSGDTEACITGLTNGGIPFEGCDSVRVK